MWRLGGLALVLATVGCKSPCEKLFTKAELEAVAGGALTSPHVFNGRHFCSADYYPVAPGRTAVTIRIDKPGPYDHFHYGKRQMEERYRSLARIDAGDEAWLAVATAGDRRSEEAGVLGILREATDQVGSAPTGPSPTENEILVAVGRQAVTLDFDAARFPEEKLRRQIIPGLSERLRAAGVR